MMLQQMAFYMSELNKQDQPSISVGKVLSIILLRLFAIRWVGLVGRVVAETLWGSSGSGGDCSS